MMQQIHSKAKGLFANIILSLIILTFVLWGVQGFIASRSIARAVASVNGQEITIGDFQNRFHAVMSQIMNRYRNDESVLESTFKNNVKQSLLQEMINDELIKQAAQHIGIEVSDAQLQKVIEAAPAFQKEGAFSLDLFQTYLARSGEDQKQVFSNLERDITQMQLRSVFALGSFVLEGEVGKMLSLLNEKRDFKYITIQADKLNPSLRPSEDALKQFYQAHQGEFEIPEKLSVQYLELNAGEIKKNVAVTSEQIKTFYQEHLDQYTTPKRWHLAHIVISQEDPKRDEVARKVDAALKKGQSFAKLAKQYSVDLITNSKGGDLGFVTAEMMTPKMKAALMELKKDGQVSQAFQDQQGLVFLKRVALQAEQQTPFNQVKEKIKNELQANQVRKQYADLAEQLTNATFSNPDTLEIAANDLNLKIQKTKLFTANQGTDVLSNLKSVRQVAFSPDVLENGNNSDLIQIDQDRAIVLRVLDHQTKSVKPFASVKEQIKAALVKQAQQAQAKQLAAALVSKLNQAQDISKELKANHLAWREAKGVKRDSKSFSQILLRDVFQASENKPSSVLLSENEVAIFSIRAVQIGSSKTATAKELNSFTKHFSETRGHMAYQLYENYLREKAKIKVNREALDNIRA